MREDEARHEVPELRSSPYQNEMMIGALLGGALALLDPGTERLLLGESPFFRREGIERALREGDEALILRAAESSYWDARRLAALALGPRTPPALLGDPVAAVREAAVRGLDLLAPPEKLIPLLKDRDDAVRAAAAWALRSAQASDALRALAKDPAISVRVAALAARREFARLRVMSDGPPLGDAVCALAALGRAGGSGEAAALLQRLQRALDFAAKEAQPLFWREAPHSDVALARAIGEMARRGVACQGREVRDHLRRMRDAGPVSGSRGILLAEAAAAARDVETAARVLDAWPKALATSPVADYYLLPGLHSILHALGREPWPEIAPMLSPLLDLGDPAIRLAVLEALPSEAAAAALRSADAALRAAACARVLRIGPLLDASRDPVPEVAQAAARALGRLGDPASHAAIEGLLEHVDAGVRRAAVAALLRLDLPGRKERLIAGASDPDARVRATAAAVLDLLRSGEEAQQKPDAFRYHVEDLRRRGLDLVLALDATGSMAPVIELAKRRIESVVSSLRDLAPDLRVRVVAYRDAGDLFLTVGSPLTHDPRTLEDFLAGIPANGGGDGPESVLEGLREAIARTPWREQAQRVVVLFGDAPPHDRDLPLIDAILREFPGSVNAVDVGTGFALPAFERIARAGRGTAMTLGGEEGLVRSILVLALGAAHREAIEALYGL